MNLRAHAQRHYRRSRPRPALPAARWMLAGYAGTDQERLYIEHVLMPHAERVTARLNAELVHDLTFRGEAYVHVGYDLERECATYERIPPEDVTPLDGQRPGGLNAVRSHPLTLIGEWGANPITFPTPAIREAYKAAAAAEKQALIDAITGDP